MVRARLTSQAGMSLIEATVVLAIFGLLAAVMAPAVNGYLDTARQARARTDVSAIAEAIKLFNEDNGELQFLVVGNTGTCATIPCPPPSRVDGNRVNLLVSDGDVPTLSSAVSTHTLWTAAATNTTIGTLADHLIQNASINNTLFRYRNPNDITVATPSGNSIDFARSDSSGFNAPYAWRGAYIRGPVQADPWGNRYAVNTVFLDPVVTATVTGVPTITAAEYPRMDVFVLSAGPDEEIDTPIAQDGAVPGDDDFIYIVSSHAK